jgi:hypothetical protein
MIKGGLINTVTIAAFLGLASYAYLLRAECNEYEKALSTVDNGFKELMAKSVGGKPLASYVNPHQVGIFKIKEQSFGCAILNTPLVAGPRRKD